MRMSDQMIGVIMVSLQKCLMEQTDIVPLLKVLDCQFEAGELVVTNPSTTITPPPLVK